MKIMVIRKCPPTQHPQWKWKYHPRGKGKNKRTNTSRAKHRAKFTGQKLQGKNRGQITGQGQGQNHKLLFSPGFCEKSTSLNALIPISKFLHGTNHDYELKNYVPADKKPLELNLQKIFKLPGKLKPTRFRWIFVPSFLWCEAMNEKERQLQMGIISLDWMLVRGKCAKSHHPPYRSPQPTSFKEEFSFTTFYWEQALNRQGMRIAKESCEEKSYGLAYNAKSSGLTALIVNTYWLSIGCAHNMA